MSRITISKTNALRVIALALGLGSLQLSYGSEIQDDQQSSPPEVSNKGLSIEEKEKELADRAAILITERKLLQDEIDKQKFDNTPINITAKGFLMVGLTGVCDELFSYMGLPHYSYLIIPILAVYYCGPDAIRDIKRIINLKRKILLSNSKTNQLRLEHDFLQSVKVEFKEASQQKNCRETEKFF